jgi:hypothetical protein
MSGNITTSRADRAKVVFQTSGPILYGAGAPRDVAGHVGNVYIDGNTGNLYQKRSDKGIETWGPWLFNVPGDYNGLCKWYGDGTPSYNTGADGDYALIWYDDDFSGFPYLVGPRLNGSWTENGTGPLVPIADLANIDYIGINSELDGQGAVNYQPITLIGIGSEVTGYSEYWVQMREIGLATEGQSTQGWTVNPNANIPAES